MKRIMVGAAALVVLAGAGCRAGQHTGKIQPPQPPPVNSSVAPATVSPPPAFRVAKAATPIPSAAVHNPQAELQAQAEKLYQQGLALDRAGHLDEARATFDQALTLLLTSPYDVRHTPILQAELERLLDQTHALEMEALREGDGLTAQAPQPAPIDSVAQMTFPVDAAMRAEIKNQIRDTSSDLPLVLNDPVIQYIHYFTTTGKGFLLETFKRAGRYRPMIERIFREEGVPQDLIYVAQAESGFEPRAVSHVGARGMWQFMTVGASDYGLRHNQWVDERQDPEKSTRAAARDLKDLYHEFGDWYLALAAYNSGDGTIGRAVARTGYADFWELYRLGVLPHETRNYIPIIVATALIAKNPQQYGLNKIVEDRPETYATVALHEPVDLRLAAECAGTSLKELRHLNPSLLRLSTPPGTDFTLHIPTGTASRFSAALALIPAGKRDRWRFHRAANGESLAAIAHRYHSSVAQIAAANHLQESEGLHEGQPLVIPVSLRSSAAETPAHYRIRRGDTLSGLAHRFGVTVAQLRAWNHLHGSTLVTGHELVVRAPEAAPAHRAPAHHRGHARVVRYRIRKGDTLSEVAHHFGVSESSLRRWNHLHGSRLSTGRVLLVHLQ
jgi:membrane-bound lytic murein transglycosylase D